MYDTFIAVFSQFSGFLGILLGIVLAVVGLGWVLKLLGSR